MRTRDYEDRTIATGILLPAIGERRYIASCPYDVNGMRIGLHIQDQLDLKAIKRAEKELKKEERDGASFSDE